MVVIEIMAEGQKRTGDIRVVGGINTSSTETKVLHFGFESAQNNIVTLTGEVDNDFQFELASEVVENLEGVKRVDNKLTSR